MYSRLGVYRSPSMGIKLSGRPSGPIAPSKVPLADWLHLLTAEENRPDHRKGLSLANNSLA